jgi:hypothetical protein
MYPTYCYPRGYSVKKKKVMPYLAGKDRNLNTKM